MKNHHLIYTALVCATASTLTFSATTGDHASHHPNQITSAPAKASAPVAASMPMNMDKQMQAMRAMHEKMMSAKTPDERRALMAEQMKIMQDGMGMMSQSGMGMGMGGMADMQQNSGTLAKRMDMMQMMMQMMMDRLATEPAAVPAK